MGAFVSRRIVRSADFTLEVGPAAALAFFTPEGERAWAQGWDPRYLVPADGRTEPGMVFETGHGAEATLWLMTRHDVAARALEYVRVTPGSRMGTVGVRCEGLDATRTRVTVTYTLTALSEDGVGYLEALDEAAYRAYIDSWREAIGKVLARG